MFLAEEIFAATCAGCVSTLLGHPLDTIKVHLQVNHELSSAREAFESLLRRGGPPIFFRGILPPMANAILMNTVMFSVFQSVKGSLPPNAWGSLIAGVFAGLATAFLSTPIDGIKIRSQLRGSTVVDAVRLPALFRGHTANMGREGVFTMVYLGVYDRMNDGHQGLLRVAALSSLTGGVAWVASYPLDMVKTRMQSGYSTTGFRDTARTLWRRDGLKSFYNGCGASTGRAVLVTSSRMIVYELIKTFFGRRE